MRYEGGLCAGCEMAVLVSAAAAGGCVLQSQMCVCLSAVSPCRGSARADRAGRACTVTRRVLLVYTARRVRRSVAVRTEPTATA